MMKLYDNDEYREEFMELVYNLLASDETKFRANLIIDAFDAAPPVEAELLPSNDPLTLEELREMDGEPVWCMDGRGNACWCLVNCDEDEGVFCYDNETGLWEGCFYGMTGDGNYGLSPSGWIAYYRKLEGTV